MKTWDVKDKLSSSWPGRALRCILVPNARASTLQTPDSWSERAYANIANKREGMERQKEIMEEHRRLRTPAVFE